MPPKKKPAARKRTPKKKLPITEERLVEVMGDMVGKAVAEGHSNVERVYELVTEHHREHQDRFTSHRNDIRGLSASIGVLEAAFETLSGRGLKTRIDMPAGIRPEELGLKVPEWTDEELAELNRTTSTRARNGFGPESEGSPKELRAMMGQPELATSLDGEFDVEPDDPWAHRAAGMRCRTCMFFVEKAGPQEPGRTKGRCRKNAPTMNGYPVVFSIDWCGAHKLA